MYSTTGDIEGNKAIGGCLTMPIFRSFYFQAITLVSLKLYLLIHCIYFWDVKYYWYIANSENCSDVHGILFTVIMISISSQSFYYFVIIEHSIYIHIHTHIQQHTHISVLKKANKIARLASTPSLTDLPQGNLFFS